MADLTVTAEIASDTYSTEGHLPVTVRLTNTGQTHVVVNGRMALGYEGNLDRELFVSVYDYSGSEIDVVAKIDYSRPCSESSDYVLLEPGQTLTSGFDLLEWYPLDTPGWFDFVVHYQADEPCPHCPGNVIKGTFSSTPISFRLA